jgi:isopropylmalate/homocitrate/citramalate synthase
MNVQALPPSVTVYEVGPRDGLQNEAPIIPTDVKVTFIDMLAEAGLPYIEVSSFVRPDAIPQLADAEDVVSRLARRAGVRYIALVPNQRGMERALQTGLDGIAVFTAASETFSRKNTNASIAETLKRFEPVVRTARESGLWIRGYVSTAFGCPYEGPIAVAAVERVTRALVDLGVEDVAVSDTIGVATPRQVHEVVQAVAHAVERRRIALHFHDTRGTALANVLAGLEAGIETFDASAGGLGGCPYAPGASGNLATEDLLYMLHGMEIETGVALDKVVAATRYLAQASGREPASRYVHAAPP